MYIFGADDGEWETNLKQTFIEQILLPGLCSEQQKINKTNNTCVWQTITVGTQRCHQLIEFRALLSLAVRDELNKQGQVYNQIVMPQQYQQGQQVCLWLCCTVFKPLMRSSDATNLSDCSVAAPQNHWPQRNNTNLGFHFRSEYRELTEQLYINKKTQSYLWALESV